MTLIHRSPKPTLQWTFCTVAIILALGLVWLAMEDGRKHSQEGADTTPSSAGVSPKSETKSLLGFKLDLNPKSLESTAGEGEIAGAARDNSNVLALGSAGAAILVGLVLFMAWRLQHGPPARVKEQKPQWSRLMHRAPSV